MARNKRGIPEINAGSMADIAFLLLIFFLVTTTMDVDKGINRKLPPWEPDREQEDNVIKEKNIFTVLVNASDNLLVENEYMDVTQLREAAIRFLDNNGDGTCSYCEGLRDPLSSDNPDKAIISLQNDRGTSYEMYIKVQNELVGAYTDIRNRAAEKRYGRPFDKLGEEQQKQIQEMYPQKLSEAEPLNLGGK
ncbi:MAG: biopolymer transporter ExbD [Bacteroidota bacterium]|nr:biopolymer transporter ExbD [Bacteroidota bacterium]